MLRTQSILGSFDCIFSENYVLYVIINITFVEIVSTRPQEGVNCGV